MKQALKTDAQPGTALNPARALRILALIERELGETAPLRVAAARCRQGKHRACDRAIEAQKLVCTAGTAPPLPLAGCDNPGGCICLYLVDFDRL